MASGQESARQKMINLMYLVFIAMLALNMSKEVLATFGVITTDVNKSSGILDGNNADLIAAMKNSSVEDSLKWKAPYETVSLVSIAANELLDFLSTENMKREYKMKDNRIGRVVNGEVPNMIPAFELMDKPDHFDEYFFEGDGFTENGTKFVKLINDFREKSISAIENSNTGENDSVVRKKWDQNKISLIKQIENSFNTDPVNVQGGQESWLHNNFERFPEIASITKLALMEEDIHSVVNDLITAIKQSIEGENLNTLKAIVAGVNNYFRGDKLTGTISPVSYTHLRAHETRHDLVCRLLLEKLGLSAGGEGERTLNGEIIFDRTDPETGEKVEFRIPIEQTYRVNPSLAIVSNEDMQVVYKDIPNNLSISMIGVSDSDLQIVSPSGVKRVGSGKYVLSGASGDKVTIKTRDKSSGNTASIDFDVIKLPNPTAIFGGGSANLSKQQITGGSLKAEYDDDRLNNSLKPRVISFKLRVGGKYIGSSNSGRLSSKMKTAIKQAKKGTGIVMYDITARSTKIKGGITTKNREVGLTIK